MTTSQPTLDDVWRLFQETSLRFQETDLKFKETDVKFKETDLLVKDLLASQQETDVKFKETDRLVKDLLASQQETERRFKETDRLAKDLFASQKETNKKLGDLGNRLGEFVQEMVRPAVVRLFRERGIEVHQVIRNIEAFNEDDAIEIDLLVINQQQAIAVECKSRLTIDYVNAHLERLSKFKQLCYQYKDIRLMGAVAGMVIPDDVARHAYRQGLFVLAQNGDAIWIRNDDKFNPKFW